MSIDNEKKIIVFDVGTEETGKESEWLIKEIFPAIGIYNYEIHGFEACAESFGKATDKFRDYPEMKLHHLAISDHEGTCKLYHAPGPAGHSIFPTKSNVEDIEDYEEVECTRLSEFIKTIPDFNDCLKILRFNAEGAEWPLIDDLRNTGLIEKFDIICGNMGSDITVVAELSGKMEEFNEILSNVEQLYFCWTDEETNKKSKRTMTKRLLELT